MSEGKQVICAFCSKENLSKNTVGLNKKLIHRQIKRIMCLTCMAEYFEMTQAELEEMIEILKQQGCSLFR